MRSSSLEPPEVKINIGGGGGSGGVGRSPLRRDRVLSVVHVANIRDEMGKFGEVVGALRPIAMGSPCPPIPAKHYVTQGQVDKVGQELVATEKTYVHGLRQVSEIAARLQLKVGTPFEVLSYDEIKSVFHNWDQLLLLHQGLLKGMRTLQNNGPGNGDLFVGLGALIIDHLPYMQAVYSEYVNAYEKAMEKLTFMRERKQKFEDFIEFEEEVINHMASTKAKSPEHVMRIELNSLLVTPIQRIPRYLLLLDQMLKFGGDGARLQEAAAKIHEVAANVNDSFKKKEMRDRVVAIDKRLRNLVPAQVRGLAVSYKDKDRNKISLVHQCRFFVREGCLLKKSRHRFQNLRSYNERFLVLFNDLLLYASPVDSDAKNLSVHHVLSLFQLVCGIAKPKREDEPKTKFYIRVAGGKEDLTLRAKTQEERDAWIADISKWASETTQTQKGLQQRQNNESTTKLPTRSFNLSPLSMSSQDIGPFSPRSPDGSDSSVANHVGGGAPSPSSCTSVSSSIALSISPPPVLPPPPYASPADTPLPPRSDPISPCSSSPDSSPPSKSRGIVIHRSTTRPFSLPSSPVPSPPSDPEDPNLPALDAPPYYDPVTTSMRLVIRDVEQPLVPPKRTESVGLPKPIALRGPPPKSRALSLKGNESLIVAHTALTRPASISR